MNIDETWYRRPPDVPLSISAGGVIVRKEGDRLFVALVREGGLTDYILPKGSAEPEEDLQTAARREIAEEAGLNNLTFLGELGVRERLNSAKHLWKKTTYFLYYTTQREGVPTDQRHTYRCEWFPIDQLPPMFWPEQKELIEASRSKISSLTLDFGG
jgi:8-oxo-dGTP pyrophosphatase MutT (NUDIX family)